MRISAELSSERVKRWVAAIDMLEDAILIVGTVRTSRPPRQGLGRSAVGPVGDADVRFWHDDGMTTPPATPDEVRHDVATWIGANWDPDLTLLEWRRRLAGSGWAAPSWPVAWFGRGLPAWADDVASDELARVGAVGTPPGAGTGLAAPTILTHGSDTIKGLLLERILTG